ncbi:MAG: AsmA-like C-terminal region-containing protein, partial [Pseudomonadota bacterium]
EVGRVAGGRFSISVPTDIAARLAKGGDVPSEAIAVDLEARDLSVRYLNAMPALDFPLARLSVRGRTLRLKAAAGTTTPEGARPIRLSKSDMVVRDLRETRPSAQIFTALEGDVRDALAYLHQAPFSKLDVGDVRKRIEGRAKGTLRLQFAMHPALKREEIRVNGKLKVSDAEAKNIYADLDLAGGALTFDVTEKSVEASGDVLVNGVPAKVRWLRLLNSDEARQPPLRLSARLDAADRRALGINVNHFVEGIVAADVVLTPRRGAPPAISVQADLTQAGIALDYLAWRKEAGQSALTQFDVALDKQGAPRLENFKVVGENISIDGALTLGKDRRVRTFSLGEFTIGVVTQMTVKGALGADNVWDVSVQSPSFDARPLFRALFSPKRLSAHVPPKETRRDGLVIRARIRNLIGYDGMTMKDTRIVLERRDGKIRALEANGVLGGGQQLRASLSAGEDGRRRLRAETKDAGAAFRLIGFYNNVRRGEAKLRVNLDNAGPAEVTGTLWTRNFFMLGDPIVNEVLESSRQTDTGGNVRGIETQKEGGTRRTVIRFTQLRFNFSVGNGQFVLRRSYVNGPALGATLEGKVDFEQRTVNLGGAYVPFYGLNSAIGNVPVLGDLFVGKRGEGMFAVTFGVKGSLARPAVLVNPMSIMAPGALRELFRIEPGNQQITPGTRRPPPRAPRSAPATGSWAHERDR